MNHQTLLDTIRNSLSGHPPGDGSKPPMNEIIPSVVAQWNRSRCGIDEPMELSFSSAWPGYLSAEPGYSSAEPGRVPTVIPIDRVAAFVDGNLSGEEHQAIYSAALTDGGLLTEIIAATIAADSRSADMPPISDQLSDRLLSIALPHSPPTGASGQDRRSGERLTESAIETEPAARAPMVESAPMVEPAPAGESARSTAVPFATRGKQLVAAMTIAATLFFAWVLGNRGEAPTPPTPGHPVPIPIAQSPSTGDAVAPPDHASSRPIEKAPDPSFVRSPDETIQLDPARMARDRVRSTPDVHSPGVRPTRDPSPNDRSDQPIDARRIAQTPASDAMIPQPVAVPPPDEARPIELPPMRWKQISGMLAQLTNPGDPDRDDDNSAQSPEMWKSILPDSETEIGIGSNSWRTLPRSRAEAHLGDGSIVVSSDTAFRWQDDQPGVSATLELDFGSLAIVDLPDGSVVTLAHQGEPLTTLRWDGKGTVILQRLTHHWRVHVERGSVTIDDEPTSDASIAIAQSRRRDSLDRPERLPTWLTRPTDAAGVPRSVLAQFADTDHVAPLMDRRINELFAKPRPTTGDRREMTTLAQWRVAMAGPHLMRLAGSRIPDVRSAAMNRMINLTPEDPRYGQVWRQMARQDAAARARLIRWRLLCTMARTGAAPNAAQIDQLVAGLAAGDVVSRAISDHLLRRFFRNGPRFDPTWTATQRQQAIQAWRSRLGLPSAGAAAVRRRT